MKTLLLIPVLGILLAGCKGCSSDKPEAKADTTSIEIDKTQVETDTTAKIPDTAETKKEEPKPVVTQPRTPAPVKDPGVLANIDRYLVSTPQFTATPGGGISNATVSVKNTMSSATFQQAIIEVTLLEAGGRAIISNYYKVVNLGPGETKKVAIPNDAKAAKMIVHVVKVSSTELTNGESVVTGVHFNQ